MIHHFRTQEVWPRFERYYQEVQQSLKGNDLRTVAAQMIFLELFSEEQQYKIKSSVKIMLRNKMILISKSIHSHGSGIKEESYFTDLNYYTIVKITANDDLEFLVEQLRIAEEKIGKDRNATVSKTVYNFQYGLSFPEEMRRQIKANIDHFNKRAASGSGNSTSGGETSAGKIIWIVVIVLIAVVRIAAKCNRHSSTNNDYLYQNLPSMPNTYTGPDNDTLPTVYPVDPATLEEVYEKNNRVSPPEKPPVSDTLSDSV